MKVLEYINQIIEVMGMDIFNIFIIYIGTHAIGNILDSAGYRCGPFVFLVTTIIVIISSWRSGQMSREESGAGEDLRRTAGSKSVLEEGEKTNV